MNVDFERKTGKRRRLIFRYEFNIARTIPDEFFFNKDNKISRLTKKKNLWRRKCVRRAIFWTVEVKVEGDEDPFNPYFVCNTSNCVTVRPIRSQLTPKMNIAFFIWNLMLNIFYSTIFSKKAVFSEKTAENCFRSAFDNFLGKEGVLRRKLT